MEPASIVSVSAETLARQLESVFVRRGFSEADARGFADVLVWAEVNGRAGHGAVRVPRYVEMIEQGEMNPAAVPRVALSTPAVTLIEADRAAGPVAMNFALGVAVEQCRTSGASVVLVRRTTHTGAIGCFATRAAEMGLAAMIFAAGKPLMAYHGSAEPGLSTSPLAIAVPAVDAPLVLDMAISATSLGTLKKLADADAAIPADWALDKDGKPTTRAKEAVLPLPVGGPKGSGLGLMFEAMTGVLVGWPVLAPSLLEGSENLGQNAFILLIDPAALGTLPRFCQDVERLKQAIRSLPPREGFGKISLPGDRSQASAAKLHQDGIRVPAKLWNKIQLLAQAPQ